MKRFWTNAAVAEAEGGFGIHLDGRPLKTPMRADLVVPTRALADAIASEWKDCGEIIDPRAMPLTGLANAAIDRVSADRERFAADLAKYGESDLLYYRADRPASLVALQSDEWDPLLRWAERRFDVAFQTATGIMHVAQPPEAIARMAEAVATLEKFRLAGLSPLVTIGGSLIVALAVLKKSVAPEDGWWVVSLDDRWHAEHWGVDAEAQASQDARRRDFLGAAQFLELLR